MVGIKCFRKKKPLIMSEENSNSNQEPSLQEPIKPSNPKLKILALHGYQQNGNSFRAKIGSFRKAVSKYAELTFLTAPHQVINNNGTPGDEGILFIVF